MPALIRNDDYGMYVQHLCFFKLSEHGQVALTVYNFIVATFMNLTKFYHSPLGVASFPGHVVKFKKSLGTRLHLG